MNERKIDMVILGLLSHESLTGYDIKKRIDQSISFFWKGSFGSIYPALSDMEEKGLITKKQTNEGQREKIYYMISDAGHDYLKKWLSNPQSKDELKYETLLKLFFGGVAGREVALCNIEAFEQNARQQLSILNFYLGNLSKVLQEEDHIYYYLTVSFGIETYEGYLRWCQKAKAMLKETR